MLLITKESLQFEVNPRVICIPITANAGSNAGDGGSITVVGDNNFGKIIINTGGNPGGHNIATIIFPATIGGSNVFVDIRPYSKNAFGLTCRAEGIDDISFELNCQSQLDPSDSYEFYYYRIPYNALP